MQLDNPADQAESDVLASLAGAAGTAVPAAYHLLACLPDPWAPAYSSHTWKPQGHTMVGY